MIVEINNYKDMQEALSVWYDVSVSEYKAKTITDALERNVVQVIIKTKDKVLEINESGSEEVYVCTEVLGDIEEDNSNKLKMRYIGG